jgi:hypothetical protein
MPDDRDEVALIARFHLQDGCRFRFQCETEGYLSPQDARLGLKARNAMRWSRDVIFGTALAVPLLIMPASADDEGYVDNWVGAVKLELKLRSDPPIRRQCCRYHCPPA